MWTRIIFFLIFAWLNLGAQVTFTEVLFDPASSEYHDEFVEIFNRSFTDSIDLYRVMFSDSSSADELVSAGNGLVLAPRQYGVILDGSYFGNSVTYDGIIPDSSLVLRIEGSSFGSNGLSNSYAEYLSLVDSAGDTLCTYRYTVNNDPGYSDEKVEIDAGDQAGNWRNSLVSGGTPGTRNSVAPSRDDPGFPEQGIHLAGPLFAGFPAEVQVFAANYGAQPSLLPVRLLVHADRDGDLIPGTGETVIADTQIVVSDSLPQMCTFRWNNPQPGWHQLCAVLSSDEDENGANNFTSIEVVALTQETALVINEIKFLETEYEPEWVEIYNRGEEAILLRQWAFCDSRDTARIDSSVFIYPGQYKILSADTITGYSSLDDSLVLILPGFPTLNNGDDEISLLEAGGGWSDRVHYDVDWLEGEETGRNSLERIHPRLDPARAANWGPCTSPERATPGKQNSIFQLPGTSAAKITVSPNPFSPDEDGFEDRVIISGEMPLNSARVRLQIFDIRGRRVRTLIADRFQGSRFDVTWDGRDEEGRRARMGIYIIHMTALNDREGKISEAKTTVVVAGKL